MINSVKVKCRNCCKDAPADQFRLNYQLKLMVCPDCFSGKSQKIEEQRQQQKAAEVARPAGWDKDDEYLERVAKIRQEETRAQFTKISGTEYVKCSCTNCKFSFRYHPVRRMPSKCPYCEVEVPRFKGVF